MAKNVQFADGTVLYNVPDDAPREALIARVDALRSSGRGGDAVSFGEVDPSVVGRSKEIDLDAAATADGETDVGGMAGAVTRGLAPTAAATGLGAALGSVVPGVGTAAGAAAGAVAGGVTQMLADPATELFNQLFDKNLAMPSDSIQDVMTRLGIAKPDSPTERVVQSAAELGGAAAAPIAGGQMLARAAGPVARGVGGALAAQPGAQVAGSVGAGAASQVAEESGAGALGQAVAGLAGGVAGGIGAARAASRLAARPKSHLQSRRGVYEPAGAVGALPEDSALAAAENVGIDVMTSDVRTPRTFFGKNFQKIGEAIPFAGTGARRATQQESRVTAVRDLVEQYGAADEGLSSLVADDLIKTHGEKIKRLVEHKREIIEGSGPLPVAPIKTIRQIDKEILALEEMKTPGSREIISRLKTYRDTLNPEGKVTSEPTKILGSDGKPAARVVTKEPGREIDLPTFEKIRAELRNTFKDPSQASIRDAGSKVMNRVYTAARKDMGEHIAVTQGRPAYVKWRATDVELAKGIEEQTKTTLKAALHSGTLTPEKVTSMLFSQRPSDIKRLHRELGDKGLKAARAAIIARAVEKSGGLEKVNPDSFVRSLKRLDPSVSTFFSGADLERVRGLGKALELTARAGEIAASPPTGVQNLPYVVLMALSNVFPGIGPAGVAGAMGAVGVVARTLESRPARDLLLKLSRAKAGSRQEAALFRRFAAVVKKNLPKGAIPTGQRLVPQSARGAAETTAFGAPAMADEEAQ